ncbi:DUF3667 domain-containing protein [Sandarakinorhabdus limnophila]|uniref:DUF3667 domain-containing protein n=1 Tax=Sandarakinorhabdus limnophila TaxID=210512 RepID=UPI0003B493D7|nr:DUF3667 domain-containing protein [Sandarakinorhabdus limnophila]
MSDQIEAAGALVTAGLAANALDRPAGDGGQSGACANCGTALSGPFCSKCGQRAHLHRSIGDVFHEFLHGITHFDGKAWTTLPMLLFRPGRLIRSYIDGHRARYVAPVPLFLMVVFLMFFVLSFVSINDTVGTADQGSGQAAVASDKAGIAKALADIDAGIIEAKARGDTAKLAELEAGRRLVTAVGVPGANVSVTDKIADEIEASARSGKLKVNTGVKALDAKGSEALKNPRLVLYKLQTKAYKLSFLLVPMSLPWLWLVFLWKRGVGVYDHAIFALYSISFMSLLFIAGSLALSANIVTEAFWVPLLLAPSLHMFASLRGAYGLGVFSAGWRTVYLSIAAAFTLSLYFLILIVAGVFD